MRRGATWKLLRGGLAYLVLLRLRFKWFRRNKHNETSVASVFDIAKVQVGAYSYGPLHVIDGYGSNNLRIGSYCSIAQSVVFILNGEHPLQSLTTFPLNTFVLGGQETPCARGDILVDDDVWIGHGAIVMGGVRLGRGSVVAAGAVVTRNVAPYAIVGGIPAKEIASRFTPDVVERLKVLDLSRLDHALVSAHLDLLEQAIDTDILDRLESLLGDPRDTF